MSPRNDDARWAGRHALAMSLRAAVFLVPILASTGAGWAVIRLMPAPTGTGDRITLVLAALVVSLAVLFVVDRAARRLLPLSMLLDLALLFPDHAPSRMRLARDAIRSRTVEEHIARLKSAGQDPQKVAHEILVLAAALDRHDRPTRGHAERVRLFSDLIAEELGLAQDDRDRLRWASLLHDIGKLTISASLLNKPGKPTDEEWQQLRHHPVAGEELAAPLLPWLGQWGDVIVQHHEKYDGTGYPHGLRGEEISLGGRIVAVADAFDVMTAARAYRRPVSRSAAYRELVRCSGTQFDPDAVRAMIAVSAPKLRRVQGVLSVLGDVPLLAHQVVPAATLARAVGAATLVVAGPGAVATGALLTPVAAEQSVHADAAEAGERPGASAAATARSPLGTTAADRVGRVDASASEPRTAAALPAPTVPAAPASPSSELQTPSGPAGAPVPATGGSGSGPVGSVGDTVGSVGGTVGSVGGTIDGAVGSVGGTVGLVGGTVGGTVGSVGGTVGGTVDSVGGTVGGTVGSVGGAVGGTVGTVGDKFGGPVGGTVGSVGGVVEGTTGTVGQVVGDTTGTVGGVVEDTTGVVGGVVGGLLGGSSTPPSDDDSDSGGGLLGGLIPRR